MASFFTKNSHTAFLATAETFEMHVATVTPDMRFALYSGTYQVKLKVPSDMHMSIRLRKSIPSDMIVH